MFGGGRWIRLLFCAAEQYGKNQSADWFSNMPPAYWICVGSNPLPFFPPEKRHHLTVMPFFWWGKVDSNHRSYKQQIYSLSPLATREFPQIHFAFCVEPVDGLEPPTC